MLNLLDMILVWWRRLLEEDAPLYGRARVRIEPVALRPLRRFDALRRASYVDLWTGIAGRERSFDMFKLPNEKALLAMFRPIDRRLVEITREVPLPMRVNDYVTWSFGRRTFVVFEAPGCAPRGIVFEADVSGAPVPHMCAWCEAVAPGTRVAMMTARRDRKRMAGIMVCADLGCRERLEDRADRAGVDAAPAMTKLLSRMQRFAESLDVESRDDPERLLEP